MAFGSKQYSYNDVPDGTQIWVRGTITFNRICSKIDGEELASRVEEETKLGRLSIINRPHNIITLEDVSVVPAASNNPAQKIAELATEERFYRSQKTGKLCYTAKNISRNNPDMGYIDMQTGVAQPINSDRDFAPGQEALVLLRVFDPSKKSGNPTLQHGVSLSSVYVYTQPGQTPEFYTNAAEGNPNTSDTLSALASIGVTMAADTKNFFENPQENPPVAQTPQQTPAAPAYQQPIQQQAPVQPVQQQVPTQPATPAYPQQSPMPTQPSYAQPVQPMQQQAPVQPVPPAPVQTVNSAAPMPAPVQPGITYGGPNA